MADNIISQLSKFSSSFTRSKIRFKTIYQSFDLNEDTLESIITMCYYYSIGNYTNDFNYHHNKIEGMRLQAIINNNFYQTNILSPVDAISWLFKLYQAIYMKQQEGINFLLRHLDWLSVSNQANPSLLEDLADIRGTLDIAYSLSSSVNLYDDFLRDLHDNQEPWNSRVLLDEAIQLRLDNDDEVINTMLRDDVRQELENQPQVNHQLERLHNRNRPTRLRRRPQRFGYGIRLINSFKNESIKLNRLLNMKNLTFLDNFINNI